MAATDVESVDGDAADGRSVVVNLPNRHETPTDKILPFTVHIGRGVIVIVEAVYTDKASFDDQQPLMTLLLRVPNLDRVLEETTVRTVGRNLTWPADGIAEYIDDSFGVQQCLLSASYRPATDEPGMLGATLLTRRPQAEDSLRAMCVGEKLEQFNAPGHAVQRALADRVRAAFNDRVTFLPCLRLLANFPQVSS